MVANTPQFSDVQNSWARPFIEGLAQRGIVSGFPDRTFRPNNSMTRDEFAALLNKAFNKPAQRQYVPFADVPANHWAAAVIKKAYETGFLSGYPNNLFRPNDRIARSHVLISLISGLGISSNRTAALLAELPDLYQDAAQIPNYALEKIAIASGAKMVVNYPNLRLFNPNTAATRADVAAFIYQALVHLGQLPAINSNYISAPTGTLSVRHRREFRGVWVATGWNIDWPSRRGLPVAQQQAEFISILDRIQSLNLNAVVLQIRPEGDAFYQSNLEPWSGWLTGVQGKAPEPFYDPLEFAITQSHQRNIELHAWFNPYRARSESESTPNVIPHVAKTHPEFVYQYGGELWMDPGAKQIQDFTYNVILDVVRRYDIDGVHLDDYFYPYPIQGQSFPDSKTYAAYQANGGKLSRDDWRRENVNLMVQRLATGIRAVKPHVKFGIGPFGIYRPGEPAGIRGLDQYEALFADPKKWLGQGWVDYLSPQLYWRIDPPAQSYRTLLQWWTENNPKSRHLYPGNNLAKLDGESWPLSEYERQVEITRSRGSQLSLGNIFYNMKVFSEDRLNVSNTFKTSIYPKPALAPTMQWLNNTAPTPPTGVEVRDRVIQWSTTGRTNVRSWALYQQTGTTWTLQQVLGATSDRVTVSPGVYALCAVDRLGNESKGAIAVVS